MYMINPSWSDSLIEVNGRRGLNLTERGTNLVYRWFRDKKGHWSSGVLLWNKGRDLVLALGNTQHVPGRSMRH
jgi:hypothetical protein